MQILSNDVQQNKMLIQSKSLCPVVSPVPIVIFLFLKVCIVFLIHIIWESVASSIPFFFLFLCFSIIAGLQCSVNFLLYSKVTQLHIHMYILFSRIIMLHHKWVDIVPSATQQDPIAYPFLYSFVQMYVPQEWDCWIIL